MKRNPVIALTDRIMRRALLSRYQKVVPITIVTEYPKSGGTWVSQILADYLEIDFPRNRVPGLRPSLLHGHYLPNNNILNPYVVYRDGRDVMVSWYFHCYLIKERYNERLVNRMKRRLPFTDYSKVSENLPEFIEYQFTKKFPLDFSWTEFVESWSKCEHIPIYYEKMLTDPVGEITKVLSNSGHMVDTDRLARIIDLYSFDRQSGRAPGSEKPNSFLRKGVSGDWRNNFSEEALDRFLGHAGNAMEKLGYK